MNRQVKQMISQSEIKKLQQTIDKQFQSSPLSKKMMVTDFFNQINDKPRKTSVLIQTSSEAPQNFSTKKNKIKKENKIPLKQEKKQEVSPLEKNSEEKKSQQRQFLIGQNKSLKQQTLALVEQLQILLNQTKQKKYGLNLNDEDQSKEIKLKKAMITKQLVRITQLQSTIAYEKRQLKYVYDDEDVADQQAEIKMLQQQVQKLQKEKKTITNILKEQGKGISLIQMTPEFKEKFNKTKEQLQNIKDECKLLQNKYVQNERLLKKRHQKAVGHQSKIKKIEKILKDKEQKKKKGTQKDKYVTLEMIAEVQQQISELETDKVDTEKVWASKIANIESQIQTRKLQEQRKSLILKQKEKQVRLNDLRIKELKKLIFSQQSQKKKVSVSEDESKKQITSKSQLNQGRKRNIIFMDEKN